MLERVKKDRLYKHIVDEITRLMLTGEMPPGYQLPTEQELAGQFGVSRTVVREAIKALSSQGLVDVSPGRGMVITQMPIETVTNSLHLLLKLEDHSFDHLLAARRILEVPLAGLAALNARPDDLKMLEKQLQKMRESVGDAEEFIQHDTAFHAQLAEATQNMVLRVLIQPIIRMLHVSREAASRVPDMPERALVYHEQIYQAVVAGDQVAAENSMRAHLDQVEQDITRARKQG